jgi:hypothetical protein
LILNINGGFLLVGGILKMPPTRRLNYLLFSGNYACLTQAGLESAMVQAQLLINNLKASSHPKILYSQYFTMRSYTLIIPELYLSLLTIFSWVTLNKLPEHLH